MNKYYKWFFTRLIWGSYQNESDQHWCPNNDLKKEKIICFHQTVCFPDIPFRPPPQTVSSAEVRPTPGCHTTPCLCAPLIGTCWTERAAHERWRSRTSRTRSGAADQRADLRSDLTINTKLWRRFGCKWFNSHQRLQVSCCFFPSAYCQFQFEEIDR